MMVLGSLGHTESQSFSAIVRVPYVHFLDERIRDKGEKETGTLRSAARRVDVGDGGERGRDNGGLCRLRRRTQQRRTAAEPRQRYPTPAL